MRPLRFLLPVLLLACSLTVGAQKYAYVDTEYILQHLPEYADAQKELNSLASGWLDEIEEKYEAANQLETAYRAERVLLTPEMRRKREEEIAGKRTEATDMQKAKFGVEGELARSSTDSNVPIALGIPAVTIGRGGIGANGHAPDEYWINEDAFLAVQRALLLVVAEAGFAGPISQ